MIVSTAFVIEIYLTIGNTERCLIACSISSKSRNHVCVFYKFPWNIFCFFSILKGKYHANLLSFQNPKMFACQQKQRNNCKFVINYHSSEIKLSISASGQRQSRPVWIET